MKKEPKVMTILEKLNREYPDAGTMLHFNSLFQLLIAVILSAQSTDEQVNRVTADLFKRYTSPQELAAAELEEIEQAIKGVGIYKNKARSIKAAAQALIDNYTGQVPDDFEELLKLPGVGRKTANVVRAVGFNEPGLGVDTHVLRVSNRLGIAAATNADRMEKELKRLIPEPWWSKSHHLLIWHGRRICKARNPQCGKCAVEDLCAKKIEPKKK